MTRQALNLGTVANDGTGDTLRGAGEKINENFTELYNQLGGDVLTNSTITTDSGVSFRQFTNEVRLNASSAAAAININLPNTAGTLVLQDDTVTLTNKTLTSPVLTTPQINDTSADHQYIIGVSELAADRTITLPLLTDNDTIVFENHIQTVSNKTINNALLNSPAIVGAILDSADAELITFTAVASAARDVEIRNAQAGQSPVIAAYGAEGDNNIDLTVNSRGTGNVSISKLALGTKTINSVGDSDNDAASLLRCSPTLNISVNLRSGTKVGEVKTIMHTGSGTLTLDAVSSNMASVNGTAVNSLVMRGGRNGVIQCVWDAVSTKWHFMTDSYYTSTDNAPYYFAS